MAQAAETALIMSKFIFKLEAVLLQRKNLEQQRQRELGEIQALMAMLEKELRQLDESVRATDQDMRDNRLVGKLDLSFLAAHRRYSFSMQRKALALAEKMAGVQGRINEARQRLIEAAKERKIVEKLRERQLDRWKLELARKELAAQDEIGMQLAFEHIRAFQQNRAVVDEQSTAADRVGVR